MNANNIGTLILVILDAHFIYTEPNIREKRGIRYSENVANYYSDFNQPDNAITTVLPSLDSDGTSNVVNDVHDDDAPVSHWIDDGIHYFRDSTHNRIKTFSNPIPEEKQEISWYNDDVHDHFLDIRGKKFFSFYPLRLYPKRAPSGFLGLRGKKYYFNGVKRVPSGFTGMRGKKSEYDVDDNPSEFDLTNDSSPYELLQKERKMLDELNEIYQIDREMKNNPAFSMEIAHQNAEKRAPSGFLGMRGKKGTDVINGYSGVKRAPSGFLGLRGKRDSIDGYNERRKRGPFTSYLGMRGKEEPLRFLSRASGFYGSRGKKYKYFGSFVGVRGKRYLKDIRSTVNKTH
ncbi:tachykinins isoform X2 [Ochlerotatus camptorhynchus]|uniref:tachykinins isoform X2 n=1 Tax=Ochlerotatus camptorhynchus TaxID=644619 RepID=UPI0031CEC777